MRRALSNWSKSVLIELINRDMTISDLAKGIGMSRSYVSGIVYGRVISEKTKDSIQKYLNMKDISQ